MMKYHYSIMFTVSVVFLILGLTQDLYAQYSVKPRTIVTTDGESDDKCSFVRFLLYTNDFDVEGLIYTNSMWHLKGNGTQWMHDFIDEYAKVRDNLLVHQKDYPTAEFLKSRLYAGQLEEVGLASVGEGKDTPGSDRIVEVLLDDDPRPVWLQAWGGLNNICQAFYRIKVTHPDQVEKVNQKARVYAIAEQDDLKNWLLDEMPDVMYILNGVQFWRVIAYSWDRKNPMQKHDIYTEKWIRENVKDKGPLGFIYERKVMEEGDSPAFFHLMNTGLRSHEIPSWGGWGGRFIKQEPENFWMDAKDDGDNTKPLWRFIVPISEDFAARMEWSVNPEYAAANHPPVVKTKHPDEMKVKAGSVFKIKATASDPDKNELTTRWWQYPEAGSYEGKVGIDKPEKGNIKVTIPQDASGKTVHLIYEVKDKAEFSFTRYKRIVLKVE
jgi:hypothetical protein